MGELERLCEHEILDPIGRSRVFAETLVRCWLYQIELPPAGVPEVHWKILQDDWMPIRTELDRSFPENSWPDGHKEIWQQVRERLAAFSTCDGIIPVVVPGHSEAVALPFMLRTTERADDPSIIDVMGSPIVEWADATVFPRTGEKVRVLVDVSSTGLPMSGTSFELPVLLASLVKQGRLDGPLDPLALVTTGRIDGDRIGSVDHVACKRVLAQKLGAAFFGPATLEYCPMEELPDRLAPACAIAAGGPLRPGKFLKLLKNLDTQTKCGTVFFQAARSRLKRLEDRLLSEGVLAIDARAALLVFRGSLCNHLGEPEAAEKHLAEALELEGASHVDLVDALVNRVVTLADRGLIEEARVCGEDVPRKIESGFLQGASSTQKVTSLMKVKGALSAQVYLHQELRKEGMPGRARKYMEEALDMAREIGSVRDIAMDLAQLGFLGALLQPAQALEEWSNVDCELVALGAEGRVSREFNRRNRLLAAWRLTLGGDVNIVPEDWQEFELPSGPSFLRAISLKYRGALQASIDLDQACTDFEEAIGLLRDEETPMMDFLAATVALEAGRTMEKDSESYLARAEEFLGNLNDFLGPWLPVSAWLDYCTSLKTGESDPLRSPQFFYPY